MSPEGSAACPCGTSIHDEAVGRWGVERQLLSLAEELAEASAAVSRYLNGKGDLAEVRLEVIDVQSLVASVDTILGSEAEWTADRERKHAKLRAKLDKDEIRSREVADAR